MAGRSRQPRGCGLAWMWGMPLGCAPANWWASPWDSCVSKATGTGACTWKQKEASLAKWPRLPGAIGPGSLSGAAGPPHHGCPLGPPHPAPGQPGGRGRGHIVIPAVDGAPTVFCAGCHRGGSRCASRFRKTAPRQSALDAPYPWQPCAGPWCRDHGRTRQPAPRIDFNHHHLSACRRCEARLAIWGRVSCITRMSPSAANEYGDAAAVTLQWTGAKAFTADPAGALCWRVDARDRVAAGPWVGRLHEAPASRARWICRVSEGLPRLLRGERRARPRVP
jgi:hypothetical protein